MLLSGVALIAVGADVRRVASVLAHMLVEVLLARERARAIRALVGSLACMLSAQQYIPILLHIIEDRQIRY